MEEKRGSFKKDLLTMVYNDDEEQLDDERKIYGIAHDVEEKINF